MDCRKISKCSALAVLTHVPPDGSESLGATIHCEHMLIALVLFP
jgi:hypothetical protein